MAACKESRIQYMYPGASGFVTGLVNPDFDLPEGQVKFWGNSNYRRTVINAAHQKTLGLVHISNNLPEWQAVKPTFFAPCLAVVLTNYCIYLWIGRTFFPKKWDTSILTPH